MNYLIRECQPTDVNTVVQLCQKHADYERATFNPIGKEEELKSELFVEEPKLFCLVVEANETIVGYASYILIFPLGMLPLLCIWIVCFLKKKLVVLGLVKL